MVTVLDRRLWHSKTTLILRLWQSAKARCDAPAMVHYAALYDKHVALLWAADLAGDDD